MRVAGLGQACPSMQDMIAQAYPGGCPAGFTAQQLFTLPATGLTVSASTPGAVPSPNPVVNGNCPSYDCLNANLQNPALISDQAQRSSCNTPGYIAAGAGVVAFLVLPGWWKVLGIAGPIFAYMNAIDCSGGL
jgi:hypothetical protein